MMNPDELFAWLYLLETDGIGPATLKKCLSRVDSAENILQKDTSFYQSLGLSPDVIAALQHPQSNPKIERELSLILEGKVSVTSIFEEDYPPSLRNLFAPPPILFYRGRLPHPQQRYLAIVGTRRITTYGRQIAQQFCRDLSVAGIPFISGLALGVDTIASQNAVAANSETFAVLASGVNVIYPQENKSLAEKIIMNGGILSENPPYTNPDKWLFPARNRIIAGLASAVLVIEAGLKSGALITARFANEQGKDVFAIPGSVSSQQSEGCHRLIQNGALLVHSVEDILAAWGTPAEADLFSQTLPELTADEQIVFTFLNEANEPIHIDTLSRELQKPTAALLAVLFQLELKGLVTALPGQKYGRS